MHRAKEEGAYPKRPNTPPRGTRGKHKTTASGTRVASSGVANAAAAATPVIAQAEAIQTASVMRMDLEINLDLLTVLMGIVATSILLWFG